MFVDRFVTVDGLRLRYIEAGQGHPLIFLHGGSLGSSADVFRRNLPAFAAAGYRAMAFDQPGFGLSDLPADHSGGYRRDSIPKFIEALGLARPVCVAHSQAGGMAVRLVLKQPDLFSHIIILGTGSLLPELDGGADASGAVQQRLERRMAAKEPELADTRKLLEANLYHHNLITEEELALRHARSIGLPFQAFIARSELPEPGQKKSGDETPIWKKLKDVPIPMLMIYGANDRGQAAQRVALLKEREPTLDLHLVPDCKHLVPWDAQAYVEKLGLAVLKGS
jgi:4,5:9,10-diseco-3-hydroxy-5,9,17-trioxoandrosta-1(10),2-diene-4-oate hydrolase